MKVSVVMLVLLFIALGPPGIAHADGMYVPGSGDGHLRLHEPSQKAVILWDGHRETMILSAAVKSDDIANFAWIVPIQSKSKPLLSEADIRLFEELDRYFGIRRFGRPDRALAESRASGVEVVETKEIDIYDVTVLRATDAEDLVDWLNENKYTVPDNAAPILEKYVLQGDAYFVANRIDLKNRYSAEIRQVEREYRRAEAGYRKLCAEVNAVFQAHGIQGKVCSEPRRHRPAELLGVIQDAINDPENPLGLPRKWTTELGDGLEVAEICAAFPRFQSKGPRGVKKILVFERWKNNRWATALFRDGIFIDVIDYVSYQSRPGASPTYLSSAQAKARLKKRGELTFRQKGLVERYLEQRESYHAVTTDEPTCDARLNALAGKLNSALGAKMWDQRRLNGVLYGRLKNSSKSTHIPLSVKVSAVGSNALPSNRAVRERVRPLHDTTMALAKGLATPLKFEFEPKEPIYPLRISSLNRGRSHIEVYVIAGEPVRDRSKLLRVEATKEIDGRLRRQLSESVDLAGARYVTRLAYKGALMGLRADAFFVAQGAPASSSKGKHGQQRDSGLRSEKWRVVRDRDTPPGVLALLAVDKDDGIRFSVAEHPNTSGETLEMLAKDLDGHVRERVAQHRNTPINVLAQLATDESISVRFVVAMNRGAPPEALRRLARSESAKMRASVAGNPSTPEGVLRGLTQDDDPHVAGRARKTLDAHGLPSKQNLSMPRTADELIETCPSRAEIQAIDSDFKIVFEALEPAYGCTKSDRENRRLAVYNIFRLLKAMRFSEGLPWAPHRNGYDWLKSLNLDKTVFFSCDPATRDTPCRSSASERALYITGALFDEGGETYRSDPYWLLVTAGVVLHEARHTDPGGGKGHTGTCKSGSDATLAEMGAWAVQYHYFKMLREKSGPYLSTATKNQLQTSMDAIFNRSICENSASVFSTRRYSPPPLLSTTISPNSPTSGWSSNCGRRTTHRDDCGVTSSLPDPERNCLRPSDTMPSH